jgi:hypothetical protein
MWDQVSTALSQSASRVLTGVASVLPGIVALVITLILAALLGWLVRVLLTRTLNSVHFDERLDRIGFGMVAEVSPSRSPTILAGRVAFWFVVLLGFLVGLGAIDTGQTSILLGRVFAYLPNVVVAILLMVIGALAARFVSRSVLIGGVNMQIQQAKLLSVGVRWMVLVVAAAMALNHLSIGGPVVTLAFGILFGGIVLALSLAVGLGSKDVVRRSWERQAERREETADTSLQHL